MNKPRFAQQLLASFVAFIFILIAILPNCAQAEPEKVKVGVYITRLYDTNLHSNDYSTTLWLWFLYPSDKKWNPENNIDFLNAKDVEKLTSTLSQDKNGQSWWQGKYRVTAIADWNIQDYPFDQQNIYLVLEDNLLEASKLQFIPDIKNSGVAKDAISQDWELADFQITANPAHTATNFGDSQESSGSDFSRITIHLKLERTNSWTKFFAVYSTCFISILLSFTIIFLPIDNWNARVGLCAAATFAAVGGHYSLQNLLPYSRYLTLTDKIELLSFIYLFLVIASSIFCSHLYTNHGEKIAARINNSLILISVIGLPLCLFLFLRSYI